MRRPALAYPPLVACKRTWGAISLASLLVACSGAIGSEPSGPANGSTDAESGGGREGAGPYVPDLSRRLTAEEYAYTVEDRLGVTLSAADRSLLPADRSPEGFVQIARSQATHPDHVLAYHALAERVVAQMDFEGYLSRHIDCRSNEVVCVGRFVDSVGRHLFRRPPTERERGKLIGLFTELTSDGSSFVETAAAVVQAMMQFPQFLYLMPSPEVVSETATRRRQGYELASRLSYYLWSSAPDDELLEAAESGSLDSRDGLLTQVDRMLKDERRASRTTARWLWDWAQLESLSSGVTDERILSAQAFFHDHLWTRGMTLDSLLTVKRVFLTPALAQAEGLAPGDAAPRGYDTQDGQRRVGLLSQPAVAAGTALGAAGGQIVARGLFMLAKVFCGDPPPAPPASLAEAIQDFGEALPAGASYRLISETRMENPKCAACHGRFDPLGFAFEVFDSNGALQEKDPHGNSVVRDGWVPGYLTNGGKDEPHAGLSDYMSFAASLDRVQLCLTRHFFEQAVGAKLGHEHEGMVRSARAAMLAAGGRYVDQARAIATSELFLRVATGGDKP